MIADPAPTSDSPDAAQALPPSKTQRKKDMTALQALGARLTRLNAAQLQQIDLPERLREAIEAVRRITAHEARRRQMQYVGKLMRGVEAAPIERALERLGGESQAAVALMHRCERWRDQLLDGDDALTKLLDEAPVTDVQPLRSMIRAARRERDAGQPPRHSRELYRWLHQHLQLASDRMTGAAAATDGADAEATGTRRAPNRSR
jgi:ribosome-associated protein